MAIENNQFFSPLGFRLDIELLPDLTDWIQRVRAPGLGVSAESAKIRTPFASINVGGDHVDFDGLFIDFKLDERLVNYNRIAQWLVAKGRPNSSEAYKEWIDRYGKIKCGGTLTLLDAKYNPVGKWSFFDLAPTQLSGFDLVTTDEDVNYVAVTAEFAYTLAEYKPLT